MSPGLPDGKAPGRRGVPPAPPNTRRGVSAEPLPLQEVQVGGEQEPVEWAPGATRRVAGGCTGRTVPHRP